jgi:hypothetical protein
MIATRTDYDMLLAAAQAARMTIEGDDILHSDTQGLPAGALMSLDKWICWRDNAVRLNIRVLARNGLDAIWDCICEGALSEPLTRAQAFQLVAHWSTLDKEASDRAQAQALKQAPHPLNSAFQLKAVTFDGAPEGTAIPAYLNDRRWNGWRMPYFPESSIPLVLALFPDVSFDAELDACVIAEPPEEPQTVNAETITTADGQRVKVYGVGAGSWTWDEAELPATPE